MSACLQLFVDPVFYPFFLDFLQILNAVELYYTRIAFQCIAWEIRALAAEVKSFAVATLTNLASVIRRILRNVGLASRIYRYVRKNAQTFFQVSYVNLIF